MAQIIKIKRGLKEVIEREETVLQYGELAVATDSLKVYFGQSNGQKVILNPDGGTAETAQEANKLTVARAINLSGAVTGTANFDGSQDITIATILESVGSAGTYYKVTTDEKGRVTSGVTTLQVEDLPEIPYTKITGMGDIVTHNANEFATADSINQVKQEAKNYTDEQISAKVSSVYKPAGSSTFELLPEPSIDLVGNVYNITNEFTANEKFIAEEVGKKYPAGTNIVCISVTGGEPNPAYKYDVLSGMVDLTNYSTQEWTSEQISSAKTELIGEQEGINSTTIKDGVKEAKDYVDTLNTSTNEKISQITEKITNVETALGGEIPENIVTTVSGGNGIEVSGDGKNITIATKVIPNNGLKLDKSGISMDLATKSTPGAMQPDNESIKISGSIISVDIIDGGLIE